MIRIVIYVLLYIAFITVFFRFRELGWFEWDPLQPSRSVRRALREAKRVEAEKLKEKEAKEAKLREKGRFISREERERLRLEKKGYAPLSRKPKTTYLYNEGIEALEKRDYLYDSTPNHMPDIDRVSFKNDFDFLGKIADGEYAYILLAQKKVGENRLYAAKIFKILSRSKGESYAKLGTHQDYEILRSIRIHPNVMRIYSHDPSRIEAAGVKEEQVTDLLFEYLPINLLYFINDLNQHGLRIHPIDLKHIMRSIFAGLRHLKRNQILHRGICIDSIFLTEDNIVRIGDFGHACKIDRPHSSEVGKLFDGAFKRGYAAPEVLKESTLYGFPADVWSAGMVMLTLILQRNPISLITDVNAMPWMKLSLRCDFPYEKGMTLTQFWKTIKELLDGDDLAMSFLMSTLMWDPQKRLTPEAAKNHPYLQDVDGFDTDEQEELDE